MVATTTAAVNLTHEQYAAIYRRQSSAIELPSVEDLVESRIARLTSLGLAMETDLRRLAANITDRNFQFFPAWPDPLDFNRWMAMIEYRGRTGMSYVALNAVKDVVTVPKGLFLGLDVDDGWNRRNIPPLTNRANIQSEGRISFTARMGVCYGGDHPVAIEGHGMDLVGSDCRSGSYVPFLDQKARGPALTSRWRGYPSPLWGAPSCGSLFGL